MIFISLAVSVFSILAYEYDPAMNISKSSGLVGTSTTVLNDSPPAQRRRRRRPGKARACTQHLLFYDDLSLSLLVTLFTYFSCLRFD